MSMIKKVKAMKAKQDQENLHPPVPVNVTVPVNPVQLPTGEHLPKQPAKKPWKPKPMKVFHGRLPVGSVFLCEYVAENKWEGKLTVPGAGEFNETDSGLYKLESKLDGLYLASLGVQP